MVNTYTPASRHHTPPAHFATSSHGTLTFVEALTADAKKLLSDLGLGAKAALRYGDFRELRFAARYAGLSL